MQNNYFAHDYDAHNDPELSALVYEFKAEGYGIYWRVVEMLHRQGGYLPLNTITFSAIARSVGSDINTVKNLIERCISDFGLFRSRNEKLFSNRVLRNLKKRKDEKEAKSKAGRASANARKKRTPVEQPLTPVEQNPTKKERKKERNKERIIEENPPNEPEIVNHSGIVPEMLNTYLRHFPKYPKSQDEDFPALLQIAYKIGEKNKWQREQVYNGKKPEVVKQWDVIVQYVSSSEWFRKKSISFFEQALAGFNSGDERNAASINRKANGILMANFDLLSAKGIQLRGKTSGTLKTVCPQCSESRKHKKDPCLSVDIDEGIYNCHNCEFRGRVFERKIRKYEKPVPRLEKLSKKVLDWFENERKISNNTLLRFGITEGKEFLPQLNQEANCICFNYFRNEELVNIKFRGPKKSFKMAKDAELIFYNLDAIVDEDECVIVEGEIDCLTLHECGIFNVVSVPNGASKGSQKLEYLDNCWQYFENKKKVVLAVDDDEPGINLREELARRLGKEKCYRVIYPDGCKDANEVLIRAGKDEVKKLITGAIEWPIEGIKSMDDMFPTVSDWYEHGYPKGAKTRIYGFDELLTFVPGQLTIVTGIPGHGKDEFVNWIMTSLAKHEKWTWGVCGFEESGEETTTKLIEKVIGKSFDFRIDPNNRISESEFEQGVGIVDRFFTFVDSDAEDIQTDLDSILEIARMLVKKKGIKGFCLNPWNWIEHNRPQHMTETEYISVSLSKIIRFAKRWQVHVFLLAHTTKISKAKDSKKFEVPNLYSISGSAHFFNKTHNGITVYRDYATGQVDVYVQKVKQSWLGKLGFCSFSYNTLTRQYESIKTNGSWIPIKETEELYQGDVPFKN